MKAGNFNIKSKIWLYERSSISGAWHFLTIDEDTSTEIKRFESFPRRGFGAIKVKVTIGKITWETSIFWEKKGTYILPIKKKVRNKEGIKVGDSVEVALRVIE